MYLIDCLRQAVTPVLQVGLELTDFVRLALSFWYFCLTLWRGWIRGGCHHAQISFLYFSIFFQVTNYRRGDAVCKTFQNRSGWAGTCLRKDHTDTLLIHKIIFPNSKFLDRGSIEEARKELWSILNLPHCQAHLIRLEHLPTVAE